MVSTLKKTNCKQGGVRKKGTLIILFLGFAILAVWPSNTRGDEGAEGGSPSVSAVPTERPTMEHPKGPMLRTQGEASETLPKMVSPDAFTEAAAPANGDPAIAETIPRSPAGGLVQMQFDNIALRDLIRFVSNIMGRNFIYDEANLKGPVTVLSPRSLTKEEVFRAFESVLNYFGFTIMATPEADKIVRAADAKGMAVETLDRSKFMPLSPEERITTLVYPLHYLDSNAMVGVFRPLMSREAYVVSVASANSLIMIDTSANLQRFRTVIDEVDVPVSRQLSGIEGTMSSTRTRPTSPNRSRPFSAKGKRRPRRGRRSSLPRTARPIRSL